MKPAASVSAAVGDARSASRRGNFRLGTPEASLSSDRCVPAAVSRFTDSCEQQKTGEAVGQTAADQSEQRMWLSCCESVGVIRASCSRNWKWDADVWRRGRVTGNCRGWRARSSSSSRLWHGVSLTGLGGVWRQLRGHRYLSIYFPRGSLPVWRFVSSVSITNIPVCYHDCLLTLHFLKHFTELPVC